MEKFGIGDKVVVTHVECKSDEVCFDVGHIGIYQGGSLIDFNGQGNSFVEDNGRWFVKDACLELYNPLLCAENIAPELWNAYKDVLPQEDLNNLRQVIEDVDKYDVDETYPTSIKDEVPEPMLCPRPEQTSEYFLQKAIDLQRERGREYDSCKERSMGKNVAVFNIITGHTLTESDGWLFMQLLKDVRQWTKPDYHQDSAEDSVSYCSLKAEALANGR